MLNPREFGNQDDPRHVPSSLHPRRAPGAVVLAMAPRSACPNAKLRDDDEIRHNPPESRARSNVAITCI